MNGWMIAAIAASYLAGYLHHGITRIAPAWATREVEKNIHRYPSLAKMPGKIDEWRREEAAWSLLLVLGWPVYLAGHAIARRIEAAAHDQEEAR